MSDVSVTVSADTGGLSAGLAKAQEAVNSFKESASEGLNDVGGELTKVFAAGAIIEGVKSLGEEFDRIQKLSELFGESAETMQRVGAAAKVSGSDLEIVAKAMTHVTDNGVQAAQGNEKMSDAFKVLGIDAQSFVDLPLEDKLTKLSEGYEDGKSNAEKMNAVMQLLGKSGADLIPMLQQGSASLKNEFETAAVASNQSVAAISGAVDTLEGDFQTLKAWGADALGFIITQVQALGYGLAAVSAYLGNLSHGFKAAKEAYDAVLQAQADLQNQKEQAAQDDLTKARRNVTSDDDPKKDAGAAKKSEEELARLKEEVAKKEEAAHIRSLTLLERQWEIRQELAKLEDDIATAKSKGDEAAQLKAENTKLDLQKELGENLEKQDREEKERKDDLAKAEQKANKEIIKFQEDAAKKKLDDGGN